MRQKPDSLEVTFLVPAHHVAGLEPAAFCECVRGCLVVLPVALHHARAAQPEFSLLTLVHILALVLSATYSSFPQNVVYLLFDYIITIAGSSERN